MGPARMGPISGLDGGGVDRRRACSCCRVAPWSMWVGVVERIVWPAPRWRDQHARHERLPLCLAYPLPPPLDILPPEPRPMPGPDVSYARPAEGLTVAQAGLLGDPAQELGCGHTGDGGRVLGAEEIVGHGVWSGGTPPYCGTAG